MLTPKQLYETYSQFPCNYSPRSPYSHLSASEIFGTLGPYGAGTPYNFTRIINFLRWVKKPCGSQYWDLQPSENADGIKNTGKNKLAPMFKILQYLDAGAYTESQQRVIAGTAHSVRNTCDLSRACYLTYNSNKYPQEVSAGTKPGINEWKARSATEYLEYFALNSLPDCLMMCGPDLVGDAEALAYRAPGYGPPIENEPSNLNGYDDGGEVLNKIIGGDINMGTPMDCFPHLSKSVPGRAHGCFSVPGSDSTVCKNCSDCPKDNQGAVIDPDHPCCREDTMFYYNECCLLGNYEDLLNFSYWVPSDDGSFNGTIEGGRIGDIIKHIGLVERRIYHGACNFDHQSSLEKMLMTFPDYFLRHFQSRNGFDYNRPQNQESEWNKRWEEIDEFNRILRARTISLILRTKTSLSSPSAVNDIADTDKMLDIVKDLLWNGYGVLLFSNVGFNDTRDSTGLSYPDRIFYTTYSIIGYDDTKKEYNECVYVLHCPFGEWNLGGHPTWGKLPTGAFLVTETVLKCMIQYYPKEDFLGCTPEECVLPIQEIRSSDGELLNEYDPCEEEANVEKAKGCGGQIHNCIPYACADKQQAFGMLFAISLSDDFKRQKELNIGKFYDYEQLRQKVKSQDVTFKTSES